MQSRYQRPENTAKTIFKITRTYKWFLNILIACTPTYILLYLMSFVDPSLRYKDYVFHEVAITSSIIAGGFVSYITWRCYISSGEQFLRWLTAGLLGFTFIYAPHGFLTRCADQNIWLFILYGPASRLVMSGVFFVGLLKYGKTPHSIEERTSTAFWWKCIGFFLSINCAVAVVASSSVAGHPLVRMSMEVSALVLSLLAAIIIWLRRIKSPLMVIYAISLLCFTQSSIAFLGAKVWSHTWWYAHIVFASGFFLLSHGVMQAFHTTRSFISVYSIEEMVSKLREEKANVEKREEENKILIGVLENKIAEIKTLKDLLPICSCCKKIRGDDGYWRQIEIYVREHTGTNFTHGICPTCMESYYGLKMPVSENSKQWDGDRANEVG